MPGISKAQNVVLVTLYDIAIHEGGWCILKNKYHSAAAALMRRGLVEQQYRAPYRPVYRITEQGKAYQAEHSTE